jgi:hypothetical protein
MQDGRVWVTIPNKDSTGSPLFTDTYGIHPGRMGNIVKTIESGVGTGRYGPEEQRGECESESERSSGSKRDGC